MTTAVGSFQTFQWARLALERLTKDHLTPNPNNYALFYCYYAGTHPNLKMAVDALLQQQTILNQDNCNELYQGFLGLEAEQKMLQDVNNALETEINRVLLTVEKSNVDTVNYTKTLDNFSGELSEAPSIETLRGSLNKVIEETRSVVRQNERLSGQLAATTQQLTEMRYNFEQAHKELQIDPLTEIGNRKYFERELAHNMNEARDNGQPLTLLMIDIDYFKKFNDNFGHIVGDQVLRLVARTLVENLKGRDVIARYGGEEFVILLPGTKAETAARIGDQLRESLATKQIKKRSTNESYGVITISVGATEYCPGEDRDNFVARADAGLYKAKQTGRNKVVINPLTPEQIAEIRQGYKVI